MLKPDHSEFIIVEASASNALSGSFYANSIATGNWEDAFTQDLISYVDSEFRTIPDRSARGISGFSMGGYGALALSFDHPELYSAVMAYAPGLLRDGDMPSAFASWDTGFLKAYGAAFSPNANIEKPFVEIPDPKGDPTEDPILANWYKGFGDFQGKIGRYQKQNTPFTALEIHVGDKESYKWIANGCIAFSKQLNESNIPHELITFSGSHNLPSTFYAEFVAFFSKNLEFESATP